MYDLALDHLPYKIPVVVIGTLLFSLAGSNFLGLIEVQLGQFQPRLLLILALYFLVLSLIIWIHCLMIAKHKVQLKSTQRISSEQYEKKKIQETQFRLKQLYKDPKYIKWARQNRQKDDSKGVRYEMIDSDSDQDDFMTEHTLATMKRLF